MSMSLPMPQVAQGHMIQDKLNFNIGDEQKYSKILNWNQHNQFKDRYFGNQFNDAAYKVTSDEVTAIKKEILHVLKYATVSPQYITTKSIGKGLIKWEYNKWQPVLPPRYTQTFDRGANVATAKEAATLELIGYDYDYHISMPEKDLYSADMRKVKFSETLEQGTFRELMESLAIYREYSIHRGTDIPNMTDLGLKGLVNASGVQDPGALGLGADDDLTTNGDILDACTKMAGLLMQAKFKPPFSLNMSIGVFAQALRNTDTTLYTSEFSRILDLGKKEGVPIFDEIIMNPFMIDSETETNSTGAIMCCKKGSQNYEVVESYKLGYYPMPSVDLGIDGKLLWMGGTAVYRPTAIVFRDSLDINTLSA